MFNTNLLDNRKAQQYILADLVQLLGSGFFRDAGLCLILVK